MVLNFIKVWGVITRSERFNLLSLVGVQAVSGLVDMVGVASIMPFLSVAVNPELSHVNSAFYSVKKSLDLSDRDFLVLLGGVSLLVLVINQIFRLSSLWYGQFVTQRVWWTLHKRMFKYYLNKPYCYHLEHSGNKLLEKMQVRINAAVAGVITPLCSLASSFFTTVFVLFILMYANPLMTVSLLFVFCALYFFIYRNIKYKIDLYGKENPNISAKIFKLVSEAFSAIKEVKLNQTSKVFIDIFNPLSKRYTDTYIYQQIYANVPGGVVEIVAFGGMFFMFLIMVNSNAGIEGAIPLIGMYALGLKRILPAIQEGYRQMTNIRFFEHSLEIIYPDLIEAISVNENTSNEAVKNKKISLKKNIELRDLCFNYPRSNRKALDSINLSMPADSLIGIAGRSGAGKTTLVDLTLGLFKPSSGSILIDGERLTDENITLWQTRLGYVPQTNFIFDDTVAKNIIFGSYENHANEKRIREVARIAQISEFIESELPFKYDTLVGERGVLLSGGQRQRLGIARALYNNPDVLILDEATSALDGITEKKLMDSIIEYLSNKTIILIAHRLTTLKECDMIFLFEKGKLIDKGDYEFLHKNNYIFQRMARMQSENCGLA